MTKPTMELVEELHAEVDSFGGYRPTPTADALLSEIRQRLEAMEQREAQLESDLAEAAKCAFQYAAKVGELERDAARYRWLRDMKCNSYSISFNDGPATNYMTVREWMDDCMPDSYAYVPADVAERMKQSNTLWSIQIYPNTPIGFNDYHGDTLDAAIDAAMAEGEG